MPTSTETDLDDTIRLFTLGGSPTLENGLTHVQKWLDFFGGLNDPRYGAVVEALNKMKTWLVANNPADKPGMVAAFEALYQATAPFAEEEVVTLPPTGSPPKRPRRRMSQLAYTLSSNTQS